MYSLAEQRLELVVTSNISSGPGATRGGDVRLATLTDASRIKWKYSA